MPLEHRRSGVDGQLHEGGIELAPRGGRRKDPIRRQWQADLASRGRAQPGGIDRLPVRHHGRPQAQELQLAERQRGEPVAAALVAWKDGLVDHGDRATGPGEQGGGGRAGRPGADHEHIAVQVGHRRSRLRDDGAKSPRRLDGRPPRLSLDDGAGAYVGQHRVERVTGARRVRHVAVAGDGRGGHRCPGRPALRAAWR